MQFVNASGAQLDIEAMKKAAKKQSRPASGDSYHKGWFATGFSPGQLSDAHREHDRKAASVAATGRRPLLWDEVRYMRDAKPSKVRPKPYGTLASARDACELAQRAGWLGCSIAEASKGSAG